MPALRCPAAKSRSGFYIEFQGDYTLTLDDDASLTGGFYMSRAGAGSYTFINSGTVEADDANRNITFTEGNIQSDGSTSVNAPVFKVSDSAATMTFESSCTVSDMDADFEVTAGTLEIETDTCTTGDLAFSGGEIKVKENKTFRAGVGSCD
ncbi:MAG: hypothetical protein ABIG44_16860 [Planctomycetota bacterium]